jgi:hypothetical protein
MPKLQGIEVISDVTDKSVRRLVIVSGVIILVKIYRVKLDNLELLGVQLPGELFDIVGLLLIIYYTYALVVSWLFDVLSFRYGIQREKSGQSPLALELA